MTTTPTRWFDRALQAAKVLQVELNGYYSPQRVQEFAAYHCSTSNVWAGLICVGTIAPCLVVPMLLDAAHLSSPSAIVVDNWVLFVRQYITWWVFSYLASYQAAHFVSILSLTKLQLAVISTIAAAGSAASAYAVATLVSFPLPFTYVAIAPVWIVQVFALVALTWARRLRRTPEAWPQVVSLLNVWAFQCCLVPIYPAYLLV